MEKYKILYVEDDPTEYEMVKALIDNSGIAEKILRVEKKIDFLREVQKNNFDLILTDFTLASFHGFEVLQLLKKEGKDIPVIFLTINLPDEIAAEVIKKGASDYLLFQSISRLVPSIHTVIERKRMKDEKNFALTRLRESEENYRILAESSPYGIIVHHDLVIKYYNKQALSIFKADLEEDYVGRKIPEFVHPDYQQTITDMTIDFRGGQFIDFSEVYLINSSGDLIEAEITSTAIVFNGEPASQVIFRDISERKRIEDELRKAKEKAEESDRLKTSFLENMSHEIRTPLNGIIGFSTLLKYKKLDNQERIKYLEIIEQSGKHLLNIINDLIEISRIESGHIEIRFEEVNLNNILDDLFVFFSNSAKIKELPVEIILSKARHNDSSFIVSDFSRLKQILINLLNNALKFTKEGKIEFGYVEVENNQTKFFVRDTGIGIPDKSKDYIFERFRQADDTSTREYGGAGLGLTISKGLVEIMGGKIWFESVHGKGTTFFFTLPLSPASSKEYESQGSEGGLYEAQWTGKSILVAEDEQSNYLLLHFMLKSTGINVERAVNGLEVLEKLKSKPGHYDLILMDIKMPEMDGLQAIRAIREMKMTIPVIAQTAYAMTDDRQKCINAGFNEYITKPIKSTELLFKINSILIKSIIRSKNETSGISNEK